MRVLHVVATTVTVSLATVLGELVSSGYHAHAEDQDLPSVLAADDECLTAKLDSESGCAWHALQLRAARGQSRAVDAASGLDAEAVEGVPSRVELMLDVEEAAVVAPAAQVASHAILIPGDADGDPVPPSSIARSQELSAGPGCTTTSMSLRYGQFSGLFGLPGNSSEGDKVRFPCKFTEKTFAHGELTFACKSGGWHYAEDSCAMCQAGTVKLAGANVSGDFEVPRGRDEGAVAFKPCSLSKGSTAYSFGQISFICRDGAWVFKEETCAVCWKSKFSLDFAGHVGVFNLPQAASADHQVQKPCDFHTRKFPFGSVKFACRDGSWKYTGDSCAVCEPASVQATHGLHQGTFKLPRSTHEGDRLSRPCDFNGTAYSWGSVHFECKTGGWTLGDDTCATCRPMRFNVSYGAETGLFKLPAGEAEGHVVDQPCVFGSRAYASGVVRFKCTTSGWQLGLTTCTDGAVERR